MFRMTAAAESHTQDEGRFEVRCNKARCRFFPTLLEAFLFYYTIDEEAELWDITTTPLLVEWKIKLHLS